MRQNKIVVNCVDIAFETWYNNKNSRKGNGIMLVSADKKWDYKYIKIGIKWLNKPFF